MPSNIDPLFTLTPKVPLAQISTANPNRDGTGTLVDVITGATNGTRVEKLDVIATGTTTSGMVRLFLWDGTNNRLWQEIAVSAITPSATVKAFSAEVVRTDGLPLVVLPANHKIKAAPHNAETFNLIAHAGDY